MKIWEWIKSLWSGPKDLPLSFNRWVVDETAIVETWFAVWNADTSTTEIHLLGEGLGEEAGRVLAADASKTRRLRRELEVISWTDKEIIVKAMLPQDGNTAEYIKHVSPKVFLPGYRLATLSDLVKTLQVGTFENATPKPPTWTTTGTETTGEGQLTITGTLLNRITDAIVKTADGYFLADGELNEGSTELLVTLPDGIATEDVLELHLSARRYSSRIQTEVVAGPFDAFDTGGSVAINAVASDPVGIKLTGTALDTVHHFRVFDNGLFDATYYVDNLQNGPGITVTVNGDTEVIIAHDGLAGITVSQIQARDDQETVVYEWYGTTLVHTYPVITGGSSPAPNQVTFTGERFITATAGGIYTVVPRFNAPYDQGQLNAFWRAPLGPDNPDDNPNDAGVTRITWTDTVITIEDLRFSNFQDPDIEVNGAALHDYDGDYYYLEQTVTPFPVDGTP